MKNKLYITGILIFCSIFSVKAQEYESCFGEESTQWVYVSPTDRWGMVVTYNANYYTIDSIQCYGEYWKDSNYGIVFLETDNNSKLWRWDVHKNEKTIIMDLNWKVGDTIYIKNKEFIKLYWDRPYAIVNTINYNDENKKVITTDLVLTIDTTEFNLKYIEGVGPNSTVYLMKDDGFFWGLSNLLLCTYKDDVLSYVNTELNGECTYPKPIGVEIIESINEIDFTYANNTIKLLVSETFSGKMCLINMDGKVLKNFNVNPNKNELKIDDIPDGVYIVQITDRTKKQCLSRKITIC